MLISDAKHLDYGVPECGLLLTYLNFFFFTIYLKTSFLRIGGIFSHDIFKYFISCLILSGIPVPCSFNYTMSFNVFLSPRLLLLFAMLLLSVLYIA